MGERERPDVLVTVQPVPDQELELVPLPPIGPKPESLGTLIVTLEVPGHVEKYTEMVKNFVKNNLPHLA